MTVRPLADLLRITIAPLIWFAHLTFVYSAEAMICAGILPVQLTMGRIVAVFTIVAIIGLATSAAIAGRGDMPHLRPAEQSTDWLRPASLLLTVLSAMGVVWTSLPPLLLPGCVPAVGAVLGTLP